MIGSFKNTADQAKNLLQFTDYQLKTIVDAIESSSKASNSLNKELSYVPVSSINRNNKVCLND